MSFAISLFWGSSELRWLADLGCPGGLEAGRKSTSEGVTLAGTWRSVEVEALLGGPLDASGLTEGVLGQLVANGTRETEQLDFKGMMYKRSSGPRQPWSDEQEFAKDVAAFANHLGGVILVGIEDVNDVAVNLKPVMTSTPAAEEQRLRQALVNFQAPLADTIFIPISASSGGWFLAVVVPPSVRAPHAVLGDPGEGRRLLRYPVRHGSDSVWLTESEIADRYRRRFAGASGHEARVTRVVKEGTRALTRTTGLWVHFASIAEVPATAHLNADALKQAEDWYHRESPISPLDRYLDTYGRGIAGPDRVTFTQALSQSHSDEAAIGGSYVELHMDGSAFAATAISERTDPGSNTRSIGQMTLVDDTLLLVDVCLRWTARQVGSWGYSACAVGLFDAEGPDGTPVEPYELAVFAGSRPVRIHGTRSVPEIPTAETTADLTAVDTIQARFAVAHQALAGLLQWFGVAEPLQVKRDGSLVSRHWETASTQVEQWAIRVGVPCEETPRR